MFMYVKLRTNNLLLTLFQLYATNKHCTITGNSLIMEAHLHVNM